MRKTKIVCTIGPALDSEEMLEKMINAGMNIARINFSHGDYEEQSNRIEMIKRVRERTGKPVALMLDTKGPEIRIGKFETGEIMLNEADTFTLVSDDILGDNSKVSITYKNLANEIEVGTKILINDGLIECEVKEINGTDIICNVINGGKLTNRKSINIPNSKINLPSLTEKDISDIKFGAENGFDYIAASFIRKPEDVINIRNILRESNAENIKIISKIENREGVDNFDKILEVSDGIMVARGDLGVEIPMEEVPILQKEFIKKCNMAGKIVITATQMLESMVNSPRPTRAEVSDVANAIFDETGAIMLSAESATGKYPLKCIETMNKISETVENYINYWKRYEQRKYNLDNFDNEYKLNYSVVTTAMEMKTKAIIAYTETGNTARMLASFMPKCPIFALTSNENTYRQLALTWGVTPILVKDKKDPNDIISDGIEKIKENNYLTEGDIVVIAGGATILSNHHDEEINKTIGGILKI